MLLLRSIFFTILQPGLVTVLLPYILLRYEALPERSAVNYLGLPFIAVGSAVLLYCIWQFFAEGRGTISPIDPPKELVVKGLYRYIRNPMYVFVLMVLLGEAIWFWSLSILIEALIFFVAANAFVMLYEEPTLERMFGESYRKYKEESGRWLPHFASRR